MTASGLRILALQSIAFKRQDIIFGQVRLVEETLYPGMPGHE
jgi:hypothetical protein